MIGARKSAWRSAAGRAPIPPQECVADCGYVCIVAILNSLGHQVSISLVKEAVGTTSRGLTIRQLRDSLRLLGATADAIDISASPALIPVPGILLLEGGHYIAITARRGDRVDVFDPRSGWRDGDARTLMRSERATGLGVVIRTFAPNLPHPPEVANTTLFVKTGLRAAASKLGRRVIGLTLLAQIAGLIVPLITQKLVDQSVGAISVSSILLAAITYALVSGIGGALGVGTAVFTRMLAKRVSVVTANTLYKQLLNKGSDWFLSRPLGHAFSQYQAMTAIQVFFTDLSARIAAIVVSAIAGAVAMFWLSPWLVLPGLLTVFAVSLVDYAFRSRQQNLTARVMQAASEQREVFFDLLPQLPVFRRMGTMRRARIRLTANVRKYADTQVDGARVDAMKSAATSTIQALDRLAFACLAGYFVSAQQSSLGLFVAVGLYKDLLTQAVSSALRLWNQHALLVPHYALLEEVLAPSHFRSASQTKIGNGELKLDKVAYRYGDLDSWVLNDINLVVPPNHFVVVTGASGSGKSTLLKIVCGVIEPDIGCATIGGNKIEATVAGLSAVLQTDRLINASIRDNITFFRAGLADDQLYQALDFVGLGEFVRRLPMRLDTIIGESLSGLSGGQRQRIMLARAIIGDPKILVLDEATSNLDIHAEAAFFQRLKLTKITTIVCTHRPNIQAFADSVIRLENGILSHVFVTKSPESGVVTTAEEA